MGLLKGAVMRGIKFCLLGISLILSGIYGLIWTDLLYWTLLGGAAGVACCIYGAFCKDKE